MLAMIRLLVRFIQNGVEALARHRDLRPRPMPEWSGQPAWLNSVRPSYDAAAHRSIRHLRQLKSRRGSASTRTPPPAERLEDQGIGEGAAVGRPDLGERAYAGKRDVFDEPAVLAVLGVVRQPPVVPQGGARQIVKVHWASPSFPLVVLDLCPGASSAGSNHCVSAIRRPRSSKERSRRQ
jgi:hypothetical protein